MALAQLKIASPNVLVDLPASLGSSGLITLFGGAALAVTTGQFQTLVDNTLTNYQVTVGKTLWIFAVYIKGPTANGGFSQLGYGDTGVTNSASAPTNFKQLTSTIAALAASVATIDPLWVKIPATKFPAHKEGTVGNSYIFYCFEV